MKYDKIKNNNKEKISSSEKKKNNRYQKIKEQKLQLSKKQKRILEIRCKRNNEKKEKNEKIKQPQDNVNIQYFDKSLKGFSDKYDIDTEKLFYVIDEILEFIKKAKIVENQNLDKLKCCICDYLPYKPLECQKCDNTIYCKQCYKDSIEHEEANAKYNCINCNTKKQPLDLSDQSQDDHDNILVMCQNQDCQKFQSIITFKDYMSHYFTCESKEVQCPQNCGVILKSYEEGQAHKLNCTKLIYFGKKAVKIQKKKKNIMVIIGICIAEQEMTTQKVQVISIHMNLINLAQATNLPINLKNLKLIDQQLNLKYAYQIKSLKHEFSVIQK